jgi:two-component system chemotaxis response regulator CheB
MVHPVQTLPAEGGPIRVLVVDDSAFMRYTITRRLSETPGLTVVGAARDGEDALRLIPKVRPDVVTLDVEMPRLNGLDTLREIMSSSPRPVIMLSSLTREGAAETIQALTLGAVDFIAKPSAKANIDTVMDEVVVKIKRAAQARVFALTGVQRSLPPPTVTTNKPARPLNSHDRVVIIGSSTGGPRALSAVIPLLPAGLQAAVVIVQHMPVGFTRSLAERLDHISALAVKEAAPGDALEVGRVLLAPGGFHLTFNDQGQAALNQNPPVHGLRPAVDVTMASLATHFGARTVGVILTGMGSDGANGCRLIRSAGGAIIAEDESTCVVWGMPRCVTEAGLANSVAPIHAVAAAIEKAVKG